MGLMYLLSPLISGFFAWYPNTRRRCIIIGLIIMCLSLGLSSLSQTVPHLIASQGVFYAIGGALCYVPVVAFMEQWFVKRKGLAFGIMWVCLHLRTFFASCLFLGKYSCSFSLWTDSVTGWHWYRGHHNSPTTAIPPR
jgi:MFS family permease